MPVDYIPLNIGIDFGSDYLTNEVAYFLGGILAANEHTINNGQTFWIAPFRSNPGYATVTQIEMHYNHVQNINRNLHGYVYMRDTIKSAALIRASSSECRDLERFLVAEIAIALSQ